MSPLPLPRHALAGGGPADGFADRGWRMSRPAIVVSMLAHVAVLLAASRFYAPAPAPIAIAFEWLTALETQSAPLTPPSPEVVEPPVPVIAPAPPARVATVRSASPQVVVLPQPEAPADVRAPPVGPSRIDLDAARRAAASAVVEQHARDSTLLPPSVLDAPPPAKPEPKKPSIFEPQRHSGGGLLAPSKARTVAGQRLSLWCNKISGGGIGFFGIPICMSGSIEPPSGILEDSIPEYMKLKPECEGTKCRLVPKDPDE